MTSRQSLRKEADRVFSEYIRRKYADAFGLVVCACGCGERSHWKRMQCSHYVVRGNDSVRWEERNAVPAYFDCNYNDTTHKERIAVFINREYGAGTTEELERLGKQTVKLMPFEIEEIINKYKAKLKRL